MITNKFILTCLLCSVSFCVVQKQNENIAEYYIDFERVKKSEDTGFLAIKFISEENLDYENFELKIAKKFPETEYELNWATASPLPPVPLGKKPMNPTIHRPLFNHEFSNIVKNREILLRIGAGEYYLVLESTKYSTKRFLFQFGFTSGRTPFTLKYNEIEKYDGNCVIETIREGIKHYGSCPKVKIMSGKKTFVNLFIPKPSPLTFKERILIWGNEYDAIYREMKVELINPTEGSKEQMDNIEAKEVN